MTLLFETSVSFKVIENEDGIVVVGAEIVGEKPPPEATSASASAVLAAATYALFVDGTIKRKAEQMFGVNLGNRYVEKVGDGTNDGVTAEG